MLPRDISAKEIPLGFLLEEGEQRKDVPDIDKVRTIDPADPFSHSENLDGIWDLTSDDFISERERKEFKQLVYKGIPYGKTKLKSRFNAFLKCDTMTVIAKRSNTSKQNIQKMFQRVIERMTRNWDPREEKPSTPNKFKKMV